jgi:hypothetical protein
MSEINPILLITLFLADLEQHTKLVSVGWDTDALKYVKQSLRNTVLWASGEFDDESYSGTDLERTTFESLWQLRPEKNKHSAKVIHQRLMKARDIVWEWERVLQDNPEKSDTQIDELVTERLGLEDPQKVRRARKDWIKHSGWIFRRTPS